MGLYSIIVDLYYMTLCVARVGPLLDIIYAFKCLYSRYNARVRDYCIDIGLI